MKAPPRTRSSRGPVRLRPAPSAVAPRTRPQRRPPRRRPASRSPQRLAALLALFGCVFAGLAARLFVLQVLQSPRLERIGAAQRVREIDFPARRGVVFDRDGEALAVSVDLQTVWADPALVANPEREAARLAPALKADPRVLALKLRGSVPGSRFEYIARRVSPQVARRVKALDLAGVYLSPEPERFYPGGRLASHVIGFVNREGRGVAGIESQYEDTLSGTPGRMVLERDPDGRPLPQAEFVYKRPQPGRSILLTIDRKLQYRTQQELDAAVEQYSAQAGTAIVLRAGTGEILALANTPGFDPNKPDDRFDAHRNRALTDVYEPGSAFKIIAAAAALEEKIFKPKTPFVVPDAIQVADRIFHDSHPHPTETMTFREIVEQSSNVGMIKVGLNLGGKRLDHYVRKFGFGTRTGLGVPAEAAGIVHPRELWSGTTIATVPIGQGIAVTPMQLALAYSVIANGGKWIEPRLVHALMGDEGELLPPDRPAVRRVLSRRTSKRLTRILTGVVRDGTGVNAAIPGYQVAGKTGTAQKPLLTGGYGDSYVASFAGFAPASRPEIVVLVTLDDPRPIWGGLTAAPTWREITSHALRRLGSAPDASARAALEATEEPPVEDVPARD